jgi:hypothetical protein
VARLQNTAEASDAVRKEYAALLLRLEGELLGYLKDHPAAERRGGWPVY